ncbi:MAG: FAD-dependent oxidoreductase [Chloroflexi bacterium]|nr:FAD-dependent oxidoreductase [Chloroflexota bacterium]
MSAYHVVIIGGGATGAALAHDLTLRGVRVTVVERGEVTSGTTGRHHGLLHSGARYAVKDPESARECIQENTILRRIAPGSFELNDGLFVALTDEDLAYYDDFMEGCAATGIPTRTLSREEALRLEPNLNPDLKLAVQVPDGTMDAMRLPLRFLATAKHNGARVLPYHQVTELVFQGRAVAGVRGRDHARNRDFTLTADLVVNAAGPWAEHIARLAGVDVPVVPSPGVLVAVYGRWTHMVINRLHRAGDGDIVVPQRTLSVIGTSSWVVDDPDHLDVPEEHIRLMYEKGAEMIPALAQAPMRAAWAAARPLVGSRQAESGRELSRTFKVFDHADEGVEGFVTIVGGKATTARAMAEVTADLVVRKLGLDAPCRTREVVLLPHTAYYA